ncbi:MAG: Dabb family protein [Planctomycetales bacterium]
MTHSLMTIIICGVVLLLALVMRFADESSASAADGATAVPVVHDVFFKLKDASPEKVNALVGACKKYLAKHPGVIFFASGTVAEGLDREVNDRDWDVGLHVVFKDRASHDRYQTAPDHLKFIEENKDNWEKVRVFDTDGR